MRRKLRKNVGVIGLGIIGTRAAAGLRAAGFHCFVWNRTAKPVPNFLGSPAELAASCEIIQIFVADAAALMEVLQALGPKLTAAHTIISSATIGKEATLEAARVVQEKGARFLDAPFTGSKVAAENRQLVYYVGGDDATFLPAKPMLEATSKAIVRTGAIGDAAVVKVVTNQIAAVSIQVLAEALAIVRKAGIPQEVFAAALEQNAARSGTMDLKLPKMMAGDYETHFSLKHMFKDVQLAMDLATTLDVEAPTAAATAGVLFGAIKRGWGEQDFSALYRHYQEDPSEPLPALANGDSAEAKSLEDSAPVSPYNQKGENSPAEEPSRALPPSIWVGGKPATPGAAAPRDEFLAVDQKVGATSPPPPIFQHQPGDSAGRLEGRDEASSGTAAPASQS